MSKSGAIEGRAGQSLLLFDVPKASAERVLLIGPRRGRRTFTPPAAIRKAVVKMVRALNEAGRQGTP